MNVRGNFRGHSLYHEIDKRRGASRPAASRKDERKYGGDKSKGDERPFDLNKSLFDEPISHRGSHTSTTKQIGHVPNTRTPIHGTKDTICPKNTETKIHDNQFIGTYRVSRKLLFMGWGWIRSNMRTSCHVTRTSHIK